VVYCAKCKTRKYHHLCAWREGFKFTLLKEESLDESVPYYKRFFGARVDFECKDCWDENGTHLEVTENEKGER
jgi:hypothetical protein